MGATENKKIVHDMFFGENDGVSDLFMDSMADDVQFTVIGSTKWSGTFNGKQELAEKLFGPLFAKLENGITHTPENIIAEGDTVVMQGKGKATTKTGKSYDNTYCHVFTLKNGKVQRVVEYLDTEIVTNAFGR